MLQVKRLMVTGLPAIRRSGGKRPDASVLQREVRPDAQSFGFPVDSRPAGSSGFADWAATTDSDDPAVTVAETPGIRGHEVRHEVDGFGFGGNAAPARVGANTDPADIFCPSDKVSALVSLFLAFWHLICTIDHMGAGQTSPGIAPPYALPRSVLTRW